MAMPLRASSSLASASSTHDVFLSFRGQDTRDGFTGHLHKYLLQKGINTFIYDDRIIGDEISESLLRAIEGSKLSIIVLSKNYASSTWCLDELVKILECRRSKNQKVYPIFYKVDPSEVRHQKGKFGESFVHLEARFKDDKVLKWRAALSEVATLAGYHFSGGYETTFIDKIVEDIAAYINVAEYPTGMKAEYPTVKDSDLKLKLEDPVIEELMQKPLLNIEDTRIWMHDMNEEMGEQSHNYTTATSTAWIFLLINVGLEISSAMFDQLSSSSNNKPQAALISMVLAVLAVIISIWELIHKGIKERVKYRRKLGMFGWFYSHSGNKIFGSVPDMCGLLGAISQWVYSTVQYVCIIRHVENPYKMYLWPIIFLLCLGASRLYWNHRNMTKKLKY